MTAPGASPKIESPPRPGREEGRSTFSFYLPGLPIRKVATIICGNRAVGGPCRPVVCWGEDSESHQDRREAAKG